MNEEKRVAVVGGGPAGLMAAEVLSNAGVAVDVYDAMPSVGRKFLLAGKGGMNITHSEELPAFISRYGKRASEVAGWLDGFSPLDVRQWIHALGIDTFVGSSGRVFPTDMKAAPLLRAWLRRLKDSGVQFHQRHRWTRRDTDGTMFFVTPDGEHSTRPAASILALGGASWARLGSDGSWQAFFAQQGVNVRPLVPSNCGFDVDWSEYFSSRHAGEHLATVAITAPGLPRRQGQFVVTASGVEGSLIYALSVAIRDEIALHGKASIYLDLLPDLDAERVLAEVMHPRGSRSMASHLQSRLGIKGVKAGLLRERLSKEAYADPVQLAQALKHLEVILIRPRPIDEAISSGGGVCFSSLDVGLGVRALPGLFVAGEMIDWEAPTGGYLLTACFASGRAAARGAIEFISR